MLVFWLDVCLQLQRHVQMRSYDPIPFRESPGCGTPRLRCTSARIQPPAPTCSFYPANRSWYSGELPPTVYRYVHYGRARTMAHITDTSQCCNTAKWTTLLTGDR